MSDRHFLLVVNNKAGGATARARLDRLRKENPEFAQASTVAPFSALDDVRAALDQHPKALPVAVGGDGTVNLVARMSREAPTRRREIGVIPMGTGNLLAHEFGISDMESALDTLLRGEPRSLDVMLTTRDDFPLALMSISTGFEADFIRSYDSWRQRLGRPLGAAVGLSKLLAPPSRRARLDLDGQSFLKSTTPYWNAGLYTMKSFAFGLKTYPDAVSDDGLGEGVLYPNRLQYLVALSRGRRYEAAGPEATYVRWRTAHLEVEGNVQIDGESVPGGLFDVTVEQAGLSVLSLS